MKVKEVNNYSRFWTVFGRLTYEGDREEMKKSLVMQYTYGRTDSLKEMSGSEYRELCAYLEELTGLKEKMRMNRSLCLKLMGEVGVDTGNWQRINNFCQDKRICGKVFARLNVDELKALAAKLRTIQRKGGLTKRLKTLVAPLGDSCDNGAAYAKREVEHQGLMVPLNNGGSC